MDERYDLWCVEEGVGNAEMLELRLFLNEKVQPRCRSQVLQRDTAQRRHGYKLEHAREPWRSGQPQGMQHLHCESREVGHCARPHRMRQLDRKHLKKRVPDNCLGKRSQKAVVRLFENDFTGIGKRESRSISIICRSCQKMPWLLQI